MTPVKEWFAATDIAAAAREAHLAGVPTTPQAVNRRAVREEWSRKTAEDSSHSWLYHVSALPEPVRVELARRALPLASLEQANVLSTTGKDGVNPTASIAAVTLSGSAARRADARLAVVQACDRFIASAHLSVTAGTRSFCKLYNDGRIEIEEEARRVVPHVSVNSVTAWRNRLATEGTAALAGSYGKHRKGTGKIETAPEIRDTIVGIIADRPHASAKHVMQALRVRFKRDELPSYRTVQRFMQDWKEENAGVFGFVSNPDRWKGHERLAFGSVSAAVTRLNQVWETDATPSDVMLKDGRHAVIGIIDVYSRRAKLLVTKTSKSVSVLALLRRAMMAWGVPEVLKTDNGKDFASAHVRRALADLKIDHQLCPPFTPEAKPHIERFFGTMTRNLLEQLPGFIGHDVAGRQAIRARQSFADRFSNGEPKELAMTAEELQVALDNWCEFIYGREPHQGLKGQSPFDRANAWSEPLRRIDDARALDVLLAAAPGTDGIRVVGKKGINLDGTNFIGAELAAYAGRRVHVRYDAADLGRVFLFDPDADFAFIGEAVAPERLGFDPRAIAAATVAKQKQIVTEGRRELKRLANRVKAKDVINEILNTASDDAARVVSFPKPTDAHDTPALAAAAAAANGPKVVATLSAEDEEAADRLLARYAQQEEAERPRLTVVETPDRRPWFPDDESFARWVLDNPELATAQDRVRLDELMRSKSFRLLLGLDGRESEAAAG